MHFCLNRLRERLLLNTIKGYVQSQRTQYTHLKKQSENLKTLVKLRTRELGQEIKERKKSEEQLRESEEKFRIYIEKAPIGVFVADGLGRYIEVNQKACELTGYTREELLQLSILDYLTPDYAKLGLVGINELNTVGFLDAEYKVRKKNGQENWIRLSGSKISDGCIIAFCSDITEQKKQSIKD